MRMRLLLRAPVSSVRSLTALLVLAGASTARGQEPASPPSLEAPSPPPVEHEPEVSQAEPATPAAQPVADSPSPPAPSSPPRWWRQPILTGGLVLGVGSPAGWLGATVVYSPIDRLAIAGELGLGTNGIQSALMLRAFPIDSAKSAHAVGRGGGGIGVSTGTYAERSFSNGGNGHVYFRRAWFLNVEGTMMAWHESGAEIELAFGVGVLLNRGDGVCTLTLSCAPLGIDPYLAIRFRFGTWF